MDSRIPRRLDELLVTGRLAGEPKVVRHGPVEEVDVLRDVCEVRAVLARWKGAYLSLVDSDATGRWVECSEQ